MKISQIKGKTGDEFAQKVISMLKDLQIPLSQVLFQCYDTTASMSGAYNGAQAKLSEHLKRKIPYITCLGHKANLCVEHSCKASLMIEQFFVTLQDLYNFLTKSTSRFDDLKERIEELQEGLIIKSLSKTRWIGRAESIRAVWISYEIILDTLDAVRTSGVDRDAILTASHLSERMRSFEFYFAVLFMKNILYKMKIFVLEVQEIDQDILSSLDALCHTRDAILRMRNDEVGLDGILTLAVEKCKSFGIGPFYEFAKKHRPRKAPLRIDEHRDNASSPSYGEHYLQEMYKVIDRLASDIKDIHHYLSNVVAPVTVLLPCKIYECNASQVQRLCDVFPSHLKDPDALMAEIEMVGPDISNSKAKNLRDAAIWLKGKRNFYPSLAKAYQLALTIQLCYRVKCTYQ